MCYNQFDWIFSTKHYKILLSQVQKCHVINFEQHLLHVVLSHCQYSLKTGFGADVAYDFPALEKHIVDRFIHGKPEIDVNIPVISFKTDIVQTTGFAKVRKSIPQVNSNMHLFILTFGYFATYIWHNIYSTGSSSCTCQAGYCKRAEKNSLSTECHWYCHCCPWVPVMWHMESKNAAESVHQESENGQETFSNCKKKILKLHVE